MLQGIKRALDEGLLVSTVSYVGKDTIDKEGSIEFNSIKNIGAFIGNDLEIGINPSVILRNTSYSQSFFQALENVGDKFLNRYSNESKKRMSLSGQGRIQNAFEKYGSQLFTFIEKDDGFYHLVVGSGDKSILCTETKDFSRLFFDANKLLLADSNLRTVLGLSEDKIVPSYSKLPNSAPGCRRSSCCREKAGLERGLIPSN